MTPTSVEQSGFGHDWVQNSKMKRLARNAYSLEEKKEQKRKEMLTHFQIMEN